MDELLLKNIVEAALLAAGRPLSIEQIRELFEDRERPEAGEVRAALEKLGADYAERGVELREISSGFRIQVRPAISEFVSRLWQERPAKYSRALLETLALIAYRQPITRSEIEEIRGVAVNPNIVRTLAERGWIRTVGHREVPGRPELLGTTKEFLDYFNLKSLEDLPTLAALRDMDNVGVQLELPDAAQAATPQPIAGHSAEASADLVEPEETIDGGDAGDLDAELQVLGDDDAVEDEDDDEGFGKKTGMVARGSDGSSDG